MSYHNYFQIKKFFLHPNSTLEIHSLSDKLKSSKDTTYVIRVTTTDTAIRKPPKLKRKTDEFEFRRGRFENTGAKFSTGVRQARWKLAVYSNNIQRVLASSATR